MNRGRWRGLGLWCLAVVMFAAGCSSGSSGTSDGAAGAGGASAGVAGMGGGGSGGAGGAAGGPSNTGAAGSGAAGMGDPNIPSVTMSLWEYAIGPTTQLAPAMQMNNASGKPFSMHDMEVRYWFTSDIGGAAGVTQSTQFQGSQGLDGEIVMSVVPVIPARPMADSYLSLIFSAEPASVDVGAYSYANFLVYVTRSDGGTYDQSNDYSYNASGSALMVTDRVTVYYQGALIYGTEP
jgi:hypothetical protein